MSNNANFSAAQSTVTNSFSYVGNDPQFFTVPGNVYSINVVAKGAAGGTDTELTSTDNGGYGGVVSANLVVTPGSTLCIYVGK